MTTVTLAEAQARLPELIEKVAAGEEVVISRDDAPVA
jgi:prevent-host-death family protein